MRYSSILLSLLSLAWCVRGERVDNGYIVELARSPDKSSFFEHAIRQVRYTYDSDLLYGASVEFTDSVSAKAALAHPDVVNMWAISHHTRPTALFDARQEPTADQAITLQPYSPEQIPALTQSYRESDHQLGVNGSNIRIGIIDSGVDYRHPALGGCFGSGCKIEFGHDLVGDDYDGTLASIHEDDDPLDNCPPASVGATGHGTFVTGLIGATDSRFNWTGVAPAAKIGMWRVFGCKSQIATTDIFIKAMEMAYEAKMDVINLSFGQDGGWHEDIVSVVADRLVSRGVHVVVASGNIGTSGVMLTAAPATADGVVAVGSSMNTQLPGFILTVYDKSDNDTKSSVLNIPYRTIVNRALALNVSLPLITSLNGSCKDFDGKSYNGSITLIHHDDKCDLTAKLDNAYKAGVAIALIYTDTTETVQPITSIQNTAKLPSAFINRVAAEAIHNITSSTTHTSHVRGQFTSSLVALAAPKGLANAIAGFSSLGPTNELALKPEIVATGGDVFSTMPLYRGGYGILSGTSMSAPLVAGSIALFLDATKEKVEPATAKGALMNFARPVGSPIAKFPQFGDSPVRQGAGLLSVTRAIQGFKEFSVSPYKLSFNDTEHFEQTQTITITNRGAKDLSFNLVHGSALTVTGYDTKNVSNKVPLEPISFAVQDNSVSSISFDRQLIEVAAGKSVDVQVTVKPPSSFHPDSHAIYGGYLGIETSDKSLSASVPYIGMIGNMSSLPILDRSSDGDYPFPSIGSYDGSIVKNNETTAYSRKRRPTILVRLLTGTPLVELQVVQDEKVIGTVPFDERGQFNRAWLPRNTRTMTSSSMSFHAYEWDGQYQNWATFNQPAYVKTGIYRIRVRALRVFGDRKNPADWDEWLSPPLNMNMDDDSPLASVTSTPAATTGFANDSSATHFTEPTSTPFADEEVPVPSGTEGFTMSVSS